MIEEAKARREQVLEDLREQRLMAREDRAFDRQGQRDDRLYGRQTQRDQANRSGTLVQTPEGAMLLDPTSGEMRFPTRDGENYVGSITKTGARDYGDMPASVQRGVINDMEKIWENNGADERALKRAIGAGRRNGFSNDMLENWAREVLEAEDYDDIDGALRSAGLLDDDAPAPAAGSPAAGGGSQPVATRPSEASIPKAPRDPRIRVVGQTYRTDDGRKVQWTGEGWRLVE
jgi:hypothetical protein